MDRIETVTPLQARAWHAAQAATAAYLQSARVAAVMVQARNTGVLAITHPEVSLYTAA